MIALIVVFLVAFVATNASARGTWTDEFAVDDEGNVILDENGEPVVVKKSIPNRLVEKNEECKKEGLAALPCLRTVMDIVF